MPPKSRTPDLPVRPNVVWLLADQWRGQATGYADGSTVATPHLDRLATEGVNFRGAIAGAPLCCPSRGSMLTGRYPHNSGVSGHECPLPTATPTVAAELRAAGYRTCYVGKWHLDGNRPELGTQTYGNAGARVRMIPPQRRGGFEDWWAYENNNRPFDCLVHTDTGRVPTGIPVLAKDEEMEQFRVPGYETDGLTDLFLTWMQDQAQRRPEQPFFAVVSVQPPHNPYVAPAANMAHYLPADMTLRANVPPIDHVQARARRDLAAYYAAIERFDHNIGRIREALNNHSLADNTYLVITSDHGDQLGSHGHWHKTAPWEESIRIPLVIGGPSREHQSRAEPDAPISLVDLAPTTLGLCGIDAPQYMEGTDFSPYVLHKSHDAPRPGPAGTYIGVPYPTGHHHSVDRAWRGIVTEDNWKYVALPGSPWLLFNLNDDPYELANLALDPAYRHHRNHLHDHLHEWIEHTHDTFTLPT